MSTKQDPPRIVWRLHYPDEANADMRIGEHQDDYVIDWARVARLTVARDGGNVRWEPAPGADPSALRKLQHGIGHAVVRHLQGRLSLHGSAAVVAGRALVFVGPSGAGKSSFGAGLCARRNASLLGDDMVSIDHEPVFSVAPTETVHSLTPASLDYLGLSSAGAAWEDKDWAEPARIAQASAPLGRIFVLEFHDGNDISIERVRGAQVAALLLPQVPRLHASPFRAYAQEFDTIAELGAAGLVSVLRRPRDFQYFDASLDAAIAHAAAP